MFIDPLFNEYTSIEEEDLGRKIDQLLDKAGISDADIYMVDKSRDTKTMMLHDRHFQVKRIVLWDTTINNLDERALAVTAHEIGIMLRTYMEEHQHFHNWELHITVLGIFKLKLEYWISPI